MSEELNLEGMIDQPTRWIDDQQLEVITIILVENQEYYHCCNDGIIFADQQRTIPLINLLDLTGRLQIPPDLNKDCITSGYCAACEQEYRDTYNL